ncbi:MAG: Holliday junction branch migration protein RuvA [Campylobacterales bacterium]|nr:Holliday junction branch migration protein RuvA [Campylobacterales bacterium]
MIVGIEGTVEKKDPTFVHLNVNGIIYEVHISVNTSNAIKEPKVKLLITQMIREDAHLLFGFMDIHEKRMFDTLIKINGIGPKVAMATCSTFTPITFSRVITDRDVGLLKRVPGIGPKAAGRILVELADFIIESEEATSAVDSSMADAVLALESLGFKKDQIKKALQGATGDTSALVKHALKQLQRL